MAKKQSPYAVGSNGSKKTLKGAGGWPDLSEFDNRPTTIAEAKVEGDWCLVEFDGGKARPGYNWQGFISWDVVADDNPDFVAGWVLQDKTSGWYRTVTSNGRESIALYETVAEASRALLADRSRSWDVT